VPPVVATVITPLGTALDLPSSGARSSYRGVFIGAALGLAIVGAFVGATRMALKASQPVAAAAVLPVVDAPMAAAVRSAPVPTGVAASNPPVHAGTVSAPVADGVPTIDATQLPQARPVVRARAGIARPTPKPASELASQGTEKPSPAAPGAATAPSAAASAQAEAEDEGPSLVPVIPAAPAPTVDPLVKAIQTDIDEENAKGR